MTTYASLDSRLPTQAASAWRDVVAGARNWPHWWLLATRTVRSQYRRTVLGPWWITIQAAIFVAALTFLFGTLLDQDVQTFLPYVASGFIIFSLLSGMLSLGAQCYVGNAAVIGSAPVPLSSFAFRGVTVNALQFLHDSVVLIAVIAVMRVPVTWTILLAPVVLLVLLLNGVAVALWLGPIVAHYRDVGPLVSSVNRILFFFTPVFWLPTDLSHAQLVALSGWNPFAYLLAALRAPLLGNPLEPSVYIGTGIITVVNLLLAAWVFSRNRSSVPYWVS